MLLLAVFVAFSFIIIKRTKKQHFKSQEKLNTAIKSKKTVAYALYPKIDPAKCVGCGSCTIVCPEGDILQMINHKAVLVTPTKCVGHSKCEAACPYEAITLVFGTKTSGKKLPKYDPNFETNVKGLYIAGELGGMGLIINAIKQGIKSTTHAVEKLSQGLATDIDILIIGAGPAGLGAALTAMDKKVKFRIIEQNSFGGTVYNFPRQKLVNSQEIDLPVYGKMRFTGDRVVKEDLLAFWEGVRKKTNLKIEEKVKFLDLKKEGEVFEVNTSVGSIKAQKVIMAVGVGGAPRKLGLANEDTEKVAYKLMDPEQYQGKKMVVVGAGDSAVEAAQRLAEPKWKNTVHLIVRKDSLSRCKEDNKAKVEKLQKKGRMEIWYNSGVKEIHSDRLVMNKDGESKEIPNDYLLLFMGTIPPFAFLEKLGIEIIEKYGEPL